MLLSQSCIGCGAPLKSNQCEYCGRVYKEDKPIAQAVHESGELRAECVTIQNFYAAPLSSGAPRRRSNIAVMDAGVRVYSGGLSWLAGLKNHKGRLDCED
jgi:hypothetical protein